MKKQGFTLAEVLITLGVLGLIAALALPALMTAFEKQTTSTTLKKGVSIVANALAMAVANDEQLAKGSTAEQFMTHIRPYITTDNAGSGLTATSGMDKSTSNVLPCKFANTDTRYRLPNGAVIGAMLYKGSVTPEDETEDQKKTREANDEKEKAKGDIWVCFDVNGTTNPNRLGYDVFRIKYVFDSDTHSYIQAQIDSAATCSGNGADCGEYVRSKEYKIDYR